jgi:hypothetical protein
MKKIIILLVLAILILAAAWYAWQNPRPVFGPSNPDNQEQQQPQGIEIETKTIADSTDPLEIEISYPFIAGMDDFNAKAEALVRGAMEEFKKQAMENDAAVKATDPQGYASYPRQYDLDISYQKGQVDENVVSVVFSIYSFTGGAHGNGYYVSLAYSPVQRKELVLADFFPGQQDYLRKISDFAKEDLTRQLKERTGNLEGSWLDEGAGPREENFSAFLVEKDAITFYFAPYQIAAFAVGSFEVKMPR